MKYKLSIVLALTIGANACSVDNLDSKLNEKEDLNIVFKADSFLDGDRELETRTSVIPNESYSSYQFIWSEKDTVGIFPDTGSQVYFTMSNGAGASSASFDGGAWTCKEGYEFRSYYPFIGNIYLKKAKIPVSFLDQKQVGNDNSDHFQKFDYMYSGAATKVDGSLRFSYHHLITGVLPWAELPAGHYTGLTLSLDEPLFVTNGEYDLTKDKPTIIGKKYSNSISVELDITFTSTDILKVYVPLAPIDLSGKTLSITITDEDGKVYQYTYNPSKPYLASNIYRLRSSTSFVEPVISFADDAVKAICVAHWDTNRDGELSYKEAAAVKSISDEFYRNTDITSFDEFQYFTGITELYYTFEDCNNLTSITIPESVTEIGGYALYGVKNVTFMGSTAPTFEQYFDDEDSYYACFSYDVVLHVRPDAYLSFTNPHRLDAYVNRVIVDVPDNEIWYTTSDESIIGISQYCNDSKPFGEINMTNNTYSNGIGRMVFDGPVSKVGYGAFQGINSLISIFLPASVESVSSSAFAYCPALNTVALPTSLEKMGRAAFVSCGLRSIVLPSSARIIDDSTQPSFNPALTPFNLSYNMEAVYHNGRWSDRLVQDNVLIEVLKGNTSFSIFDVPTIGPWAAGNCNKLQSITIGQQCTAIGDSAFRNCTNLSKITFYSSTPPNLLGSIRDTFDNTNNCPIEVPSSSVNTYKTTWSEVASRIVGY